MSNIEDGSSFSPVRRVVETLTAELTLRYPDIESATVRHVISHAAVEFGELPGEPLLRRLVRRRATAQLEAMSGHLTPIRRRDLPSA